MALKQQQTKFKFLFLRKKTWKTHRDMGASSNSYKTQFLWAKCKWIRSIWITFLLNMGLQIKGKSGRWNSFWFCPNPKCLRNSLRCSMNPNVAICNHSCCKLLCKLTVLIFMPIWDFLKSSLFQKHLSYFLMQLGVSIVENRVHACVWVIIRSLLLYERLDFKSGFIFTYVQSTYWLFILLRGYLGCSKC